MLSDNTNYEAVLCFADFESATLTPTNVSKPANELIVFNGVPKGDYGIWLHSTDGSFGNSYEININATNPSGNYKSIIGLSDNLQYFGIITESGSIYANGQYLFEDSIIGTNTGNTFNWKRTHDFQTGIDYSYLNMEVQNVMPIFCGIGTTWIYTESKPFTMVDVFGRKTPRPLDFLDVKSFELHDRYHILAYDISTDEVIDFFSPLNAFYFTGAESDPINGITKGNRPPE